MTGFSVNQFLPANQRGRQRVEFFSTRLFSSFPEASIEGLSKIAGDKKSLTRSVPGRASATLAYWYYRQGEFDRARHYVDQIVLPHFFTGKRELAVKVLRAQTHAALGSFEPARKLIDEKWPSGPAKQLSMPIRAAILRGQMDDYSTRPNEHPILAYLNEQWRAAGLRQVCIFDESQPFSVANLAADPKSVSTIKPSDRGKITVICPVYDVEETLAGMLRGLAEQSYENLEIIIVDDGSTDGTADIAAKICAGDKRFRLIRQLKNMGGYVARNTALAEATGDFVSVQCGDDWSHPDKFACAIETQMGSDRLYHWAGRLRLTSENRALEVGRSISGLVHEEWPSALMGTDLVRSMGGWDTTRIAGDTEMHLRINRAHGLARADTHHVTVRPGLVLSLAAVIENSLSYAKRTHVTTIAFGVRQNYRLMGEVYYNKNSDDLSRRTGVQGALYPVPGFIRPEREEPTQLKVALVGDFSAPEWNDRIAAMVSALGDQLGVFQYPDFNAPEPDYAVPYAVCKILMENGASLLAAGEKVQADRLIVATTHQLPYKLERSALFTCRSLEFIDARSVTPNEKLLDQLKANHFVDGGEFQVKRHTDWSAL
ncbi:MAG: glycosyltransferase family A protein [Pseudomonadota bacterium]